MATCTIPAVKQTSSFMQLVLKLAEKGNVLMIHIYDCNLIISKGVNFDYSKCQHYNQHRHHECKNNIFVSV